VFITVILESEMINIIVDAMGGDKAPQAIIEGCIEALNMKEGFSITLVGNSDIIESHLATMKFDAARINIVNASEVITGEDKPTKAIRGKKDSSMVVGLKLLKEKSGDAFISAGNTGALMTGALLLVGRIKGIDRPSLPALVPSKKGMVLIIDAGMNTVCRSINYLQFGIMGSIYMKLLYGIESPKVGLLNVGSENEKGNDVLKQAFSTLTEANLNFVGNIEGNDIPDGKIDVAVSDGFVGNVCLKMYEGAGSFLLKELKNIFTTNILTKICYLLLKPSFKGFKKKFDADELGGAPVLGVNGLVIKSHGSSNSKAIRNVILKRAIPLIENQVIQKIIDGFKDSEVTLADDDAE
jgi:glycerol-3-phosphate acyltransferase PlsX